MARRRRNHIILSAILTSALCNNAQALVINEIRIDQTGSDHDEFFELAGQANQSLEGVSYLVLGDSNSDNSGIIESATDLSGLSLDQQGLFLAAESSYTLGGSPNLVTRLNFENNDSVTHLLVRGFTGHRGDDLDTDGDGQLDIIPWLELLDAIAFEVGASGDTLYSEHRLVVSKPSHAYRTDYASPQWQAGTMATGHETPNSRNQGQHAWLARTTHPLVAVPLPGTLGLFLLGLIVLARRGRARRAARLDRIEPGYRAMA